MKKVRFGGSGHYPKMPLGLSRASETPLQTSRQVSIGLDRSLGEVP